MREPQVVWVGPCFSMYLLYTGKNKYYIIAIVFFVCTITYILAFSISSFFFSSSESCRCLAEDMLVVLLFDPNRPPLSDDVFLVCGFAALLLVPLLVALFLRLAVVVSYKLGMGLYFTRPSRKLVIVMSTFLVDTGYLCVCMCVCV